MFVFSRDVSAAKQVIATLLATAMVLWAFGVHTFAEAANITDVSDTLSDSSPGASPTHTISFITPSGVANSETITITFPAGFTGIGSIVDGDVTIEDDTTDISGNVSAAGAGQTVTLTVDTGSIAADSVVDIVIGSTNFITSPTPTEGNESFEIAISAGTQDSGYARVVILDTVLVTAQVDTVFDFTVTGLGSGVAVNGTTTDIVSSSTTIPFGTLTAYNTRTGAQDLQVQTNARNGFVVTVEADGALRSSTGADIDGFVDSSYTAVPTTWESPLVGLDVLDENTWGHWGMTTEDNDTGISGDDGLFPGDEVLSNEWFGVTTTPRVIFAHDGPADNSTPDVGSTTVGYQVEISPLQEAGDDYQTTLTYIATPTF
jgi:hypothetical protein